jgi:hypothetical protein
MNSSTASLPRTARSPSIRDGRLDFWRGLCLIDMVLVHMVHHGVNFGQPWFSILGEYTRFAAGGFIFVSGMSIGAIFLPRARDGQRRRKTYLGLFRRSGYILAVHYVATASFLLLYPLFGSGPFPSVWALLRDILLLRSGSDLLPFYVVMVAVAPLLLELLRRGLWWVVAALSIAVFIFWGQGNPYYLAFPIQECFLIPLWQTIFIGGVLAGAFLPVYDRWSLLAKRIAAAGSVLFLIVIFFGAYGGDFNLALPLPVVFWKVPLSVGEILKYLACVLALMTVTDLCWKRLASSAVVRFAGRMGRRSLAMYVTHVWIVALIVAWAGKLGWAGAPNLLLAAGAVGLLWAVAWGMDFCKSCSERPIDWPAAFSFFSWWRAGFNFPATAMATVGMLFLSNALLQNPDVPVQAAGNPLELPEILPGEQTLDADALDLFDNPDFFPSAEPAISLPFDNIPA